MHKIKTETVTYKEHVHMPSIPHASPKKVKTNDRELLTAINKVQNNVEQYKDSLGSLEELKDHIIKMFNQMDDKIKSLQENVNMLTENIKKQGPAKDGPVNMFQLKLSPEIMDLLTTTKK